MQVAEVFCGGFSGFSQALSLLHKAFLPFTPCMEAMGPGSTEISTDPGPESALSHSTDFDDLSPEDNVLVQANVVDEWWFRIFTHRPIHIATVRLPLCVGA